MKRRILAIFLGAMLPLLTQAQVPDLTERLVRMMDVITENHIQPKTIDAAFVAHVNSQFIEAIDPDQLILTTEDLERMERTSQQLSGALRQNGAVYIDSALKVWEEACVRAEEIVKELFAQPIAMEGTWEPALFEGHVSQEQLRSKWHGVVRADILSRIMDALDASELSEEKVNERVEEVTQAVASEFMELLENLRLFEADFEDAFLNAVASTFDPHTSYFSAATNKEFEQELSAERELFGISYGRSAKGELVITEVLPGSAAWLSGEIHEGDKLIRVVFDKDHSYPLKGKTAYQLGKLFDEHDATEIALTVQTGTEEERSVPLVKSKVYSDADVIKSAVLEGKRKVGYIALPDFYTNWEDQNGLGCANDLAKVVIKLKQENVEGIILDLRDNGGGSLRESIDLAGIFINYGPMLVVDDGGEKPRSLKDLNRGLIFSGPLIVMINGYSASASEVVAGVLQDYNRALIVGAPSFGKATGQQVLPLAPMDVDVESDAFDTYGYAKVTNAALYRITLETNQIRGVIPDVPLPLASRGHRFREGDYPTALEHPLIEKQMYYTAMTALDVPQIRSESGVRVANNDSLSEITQLLDTLERSIDAFDPYVASVLDWVAFEREFAQLSERLDVLRSNFRVTFTPEGVVYDSEVYRMDAVLRMYNDRFLSRLKTDIDLSETYEIMNQLITK